jgi:enoyl-CoA hydratase
LFIGDTTLNLPTYQTLLTEIADRHILVVTLNRPDVLNAINTQMGIELLDLWTRLIAEPGDVRCVVLTGAGDRAFCAGADLKERNDMSKEAWHAQHEIFERAFWATGSLTVPLIVAVNGHAYAGGLEIMLYGDFAYAVKTARFVLTEVTLGIMPGGGGTQNLPRAVGERRAKEIILTGKPFGAEQALAWSMVN